MPSRVGDNSDCKDLNKYQLPRVKAIKTRCEYVPIRSDFSSLKNKVLISSSRGSLTIEV